MVIRAFPLIVSCLLFININCEDVIVNTQVKRVIDVSAKTAITRTTVTLKNKGTDPISEFVLAIPPSEAHATHDVWVTQQVSSSSKAQPISIEFNASSYIVKLASAIAPSSTTTVDIRQDVSNAAKPVPDTLSGFDSQYLRYAGLAHYYSAYDTLVETTTIILPTSSILSQHNVPKPHSLASKRLELGPYEHTTALTHTQMSLRYRNDNGFLVAKRYIKETRAGHWGTIGVSEEYEIYNAAAKHIGEWSRVDYASGFGSSYKTAVADVWANLPADAVNIEYRDLIGNITTSRLRKPSKSKRALQLKFRYPLMGAWKNHFWYTYDLKHDKHVVRNKDNGYYHFKVPIWPTANTDLQCEDYELRIVLPEWAEDINLVSHPSIRFEKEVRMERMSVTLLGRQVIILKAKMLRSRSKHQNTVTVTYKYNDVLRWVTPSMTIAGVFILVMASLSMFLRNIDVSSDIIDKKEKTS